MLLLVFRCCFTLYSTIDFPDMLWFFILRMQLILGRYIRRYFALQCSALFCCCFFIIIYFLSYISYVPFVEMFG